MTRLLKVTVSNIKQNAIKSLILTNFCLFNHNHGAALLYSVIINVALVK